MTIFRRHRHRHQWGPWEPAPLARPAHLAPDEWYPTRDPFKQQRKCQSCTQVDLAGYGGG